MFIGEDELNIRLSLWKEKGIEKGINIITFPGRGTEFLDGIILSYLNSGENVLLITGQKKIPGKFEGLKGKFNSLSFDGAMKEREEYGLIIYDDINSMPLRDWIEIKSIINVLYSKCSRFIALSTGRIFRDMPCEYLFPGEAAQFMTEPRLISTRLDVSQVLPTALFDFMNYFKNDGRKAVIVCPSVQSAEGMMNYLKRISPDFSDKTIKSWETEDEVIEDLSLSGNGPLFIYTDSIENIPVHGKDFDYVVLDASSSKYNSRQFVHLLGLASSGRGAEGEVLLVASEVSESMNLAKDISREFNRMLWEADFFSKG